jgi:hypothetical protein
LYSSNNSLFSCIKTNALRFEELRRERDEERVSPQEENNLSAAADVAGQQR